jgi:hypothetical protein
MIRDLKKNLVRRRKFGYQGERMNTIAKLQAEEIFHFSNRRHPIDIHLSDE